MIVLRCDVTRVDDVTAALAAAAAAEADLPPVRGIVHAACPPQRVRGAAQEEEEEEGREEDGSLETVDYGFLEAKVSLLWCRFVLLLNTCPLLKHSRPLPLCLLS